LRGRLGHVAADRERMRVWSPGRPLDLRATLGPLTRGVGDPTCRLEGGTSAWRTARTPDGPGLQRLDVRPPTGEVTARAWGPGSAWLLDTLPDLLGAADAEAEAFDPRHPLLRETWRRHQGWRVPRTALVMEALVLAVLEQKVTGLEARRSWRGLLRRFGSPPPGPAPLGMAVVPAAAEWAAVPSWEWHRLGVGPQRSATVVRAAGRAAALERTLALPPHQVEAALRSLPGVGAWTAAEVRQRAHGDPDAVSVGDVHLAGQVVYALTGAVDGDDARMLELLEPYAGHRYRAVRMVELSGVARPRRGPRYAPLDHRTR